MQNNDVMLRVEVEVTRSGSIVLTRSHSKELAADAIPVMTIGALQCAAMQVSKLCLSEPIPGRPDA